MSLALSENFEELKPEGITVVAILPLEDIERFTALAVVEEEVHRLSFRSRHLRILYAYLGEVFTPIRDKGMIKFQSLCSRLFALPSQAHGQHLRRASCVYMAVFRPRDPHGEDLEYADNRLCVAV